MNQNIKLVWPYAKTDLNFLRDSLSRSFLEWFDADPAFKIERSCYHALSSTINLKLEIICIIVLLFCCLKAAHSWVQAYPTLLLPVHRSDALTRSVKETPVTITCLCLLFGFGMGQECRNWEREWNVKGCPPDVRRVLHCRFQRATWPPHQLLQRRSKVCCILIYTGRRRICLETA